MTERPPELRTERLRADDPAALSRAAALLRTGGTVAFPTETVYGLAANALNAQAVTKIFMAKERPGWDPLIVHIANRAMLNGVATLASEVETVRRTETLMTRFWPGPLTLLLPRTVAIPDAVTAGRALVGVRMPAHPVALALIRAAGLPLAAPSANRFGRTSPTTAEHVLANPDGLDGRIEAVLDGGPCAVGVESTVLDPAPWPMVLYRPGAVTKAMIEELCGPGSVCSFVPPTQPAAPEALPSPGVGLRHYAPRARLLLVSPDNLHVKKTLAGPMRDALSKSQRIGIMLPDGWEADSRATLFAWGPWTEPTVLAQRLFAGLHALDMAGAELILCPLPAAGGLSEALRDRLQKAAR